MDVQTESMIKDAIVCQLLHTQNWYIVYTYESARYLLTMNNTFTTEENVIKFPTVSDAVTYLSILQANIGGI